MQLDDSLLGEIESVAERRRLPAGEVLVAAGEVDDQVYVLVDGELVVFLDSDGVEAEVSRIPPRTLVGEISAIAGGPRTATVRAPSSYATAPSMCRTRSLRCSPANARAG